MTAYLLVIHLLNFVAPAAAVAVLLVLFGRMFGSFLGLNRASAQSFIARVAIIFMVNVLVLGVGLAVFGHDGKMVTFAVMALAASGTLWALQRA
jgi:hypothetical protein